MATSAAVRAAAPAVADRAQGKQASRPRALFTATLIGAAAAAVAYKLLRSAPSSEGADNGSE